MTTTPPPPPPPGARQPVATNRVMAPLVAGKLIRSDLPLAAEPGPNGWVQASNQGRSWTLSGSTGESIVHASDVADMYVSPTTITTSVHPTWAIVLGCIGLFFFLIGIVFFFIKTDKMTPGALVTWVGRDGRRVVVQCARDPYLLAAQLGVRVG